MFMPRDEMAHHTHSLQKKRGFCQTFLILLFLLLFILATKPPRAPGKLY